MFFYTDKQKFITIRSLHVCQNEFKQICLELMFALKGPLSLFILSQFSKPDFNIIFSLLLIFF